MKGGDKMLYFILSILIAINVFQSVCLYYKDEKIKELKKKIGERG